MVELAKPRIEYYSKSKGKYIDIESMNEVHLMNAIRKMVIDTKRCRVPCRTQKSCRISVCDEYDHRG